MKILRINPNAFSLMKQAAEASYPNECCGFFYGIENEKREIFLARPVKNDFAGDQRKHFEVHPRDYIQAERFADENEIRLLGIFHSHPEGPAIPSELDLYYAQPFFSYIILSVKSARTTEVRSWQLDQNRTFVEESIEPIK